MREKCKMIDLLLPDTKSALTAMLLFLPPSPRGCGSEVAVRRSDCLQVLLDLLVGVALPVREQAVAVCRQHW